MRQPKDIYRDACGRSHRILGAYLALWAWKKGVDCVALDRSELLPFLGVEAMRDKRLQWLAEDTKDFFPHQKPLISAKQGGHASLYLSRRPFPDDAFKDVMTDTERVKRLARKGLLAAVGSLPTEDRMIAALARAATGGGRQAFVRRRKNILDWMALSASLAAPEATPGDV